MAKKKKKPSGKTWVYQVEILGIVRYIGITNCLKRRETEHNSGLKKGDDKMFYTYLRSEGIETIELIPIIECKDRVTAKRWEMYYILEDWTCANALKQNIPCISDRASSKPIKHTLS